MLEQYGPCALHRQSFQPVKTALEKNRMIFVFKTKGNKLFMKLGKETCLEKI